MFANENNLGKEELLNESDSPNKRLQPTVGVSSRPAAESYDKNNDISLEQEKSEIGAQIEQAYRLGLHHYKEALSFASIINDETLTAEEQEQNVRSGFQKYELAAYAFAEVLKPALSKLEMLSLHVKIEDYKYIILNSIEHLGEIYLTRTNTFNNYAKATAIFQYAAAFAKEHKIEYSDILYIKNSHDVNVIHGGSLFQNTSDTNKTSVSQKLFIPLHQYYIDKAYEVEQLLLNNSAHKNSESKSDTDQNKLKLYKQELMEFREIIGDSLKEFDKRPIEEVSIRAREVQDLYKAYSDFLVDKNKSNVDTNINGIISSNTNDRDLENSGDIKVNNTCGLLQRLINDCFNQLSPAPDGCEYAFVGSGSLGGGRITPWSDLEFFILINEDKEEYKKYFREFAQLLHIKVINMGETPLRTAAIDELNNFKTGEEKDDWFWDEYVRKGFTFDAFHWDACKIPFGRQGGYKVKQKLKQEDGSYKEEFIQKEDFELILTPKKLAEFQHEILENEVITDLNNNNNSNNTIIYADTINGKSENDSTDDKNDSSSRIVQKVSWYKSDTHLVQALRMGGILITGSQKLLDQYRYELRNESKVTKEIIEERILKTLRKDLSSFSLKLGDKEEGKLIDVKNDIFRIADRVIDALALYFNISAEEGETGVSAWELIDRMQQRAHLSKDGAQHLKEALSIAAELRLATYLHNKGQRDSFSTYQPETSHLEERDRKKLIEDTFYIKSTDILHHFYYITVKLQSTINKLYDDRQCEEFESTLGSSKMFDGRAYLKCMVHARFMKYSESLKLIPKVLKEENLNDEDLNKLLTLCVKTENPKEAIVVSELMNSKDKGISQNYEVQCNTGYVYYTNNDYLKAYEWFRLSLDTLENAKLDKESIEYKHAYAVVNNALGIALYAMEEYDDSLKCYKIAYDEFKKCNFLEEAASCYLNIGVIHRNKNEHSEAINYFKSAIEMYGKVYSSQPNHPNIATAHNNLGSVYEKDERYPDAEKEYDLALKIFEIVNNDNLHSPHIANCCNNLGSLSIKNDNFLKAMQYYSRAKAIFSYIYNKEPEFISPDIITTYKGLAQVHEKLKDIGKVLECHEKALSLQRKIYKPDLEHSEIINTQNSITELKAKINKSNKHEAIEYVQTEDASNYINNSLENQKLSILVDVDGNDPGVSISGVSY